VVRHQHAVPTSGDLARPLPVPQVRVRHDAVALGCAEELRPEAKQAAERDRVAQAHVLPLEVEHLVDDAAAFAEHVNDRSLKLLGYVEDQCLVRLQDLAALLLGDDLRHGNLELVPFAPHLLDENGQLHARPSRQVNRSGRSPHSTAMDTFVRSSRSIRSLSLFEVTYLPSMPPNGLSLTMNIMDNVGSSILMVGSVSGLSGSASVSPIVNSSRPVMAMMSPIFAL